MKLVSDGQEVASGSFVTKPICSPDGTTWLATVIKDGKSYVLTNAQESSGYDEIIDGPVLSLDGQHFAFAAKKANLLYLVRDGKEELTTFLDIMLSGGGFIWPGIGESSPVLRFSPDNQTLAFAAKREDGQMIVVINEKTYGPYENIMTIVFSPDGKHMMFVVKKGNEKDKTVKQMVVLEGVEGQWYEQVAYPCFSKDGKYYAYAVKSSEVWQIVLNGVLRTTQYQDIESLLFAPNDEFILSADLTSQKTVVYVGDIAGKEWDMVSHIDSENFDKVGNLNYLVVADKKLYRITKTLSGLREEH
jgi:Tol biopolymer transport system component